MVVKLSDIDADPVPVEIELCMQLVEAVESCDTSLLIVSCLVCEDSDL
jgi:hypothetical protein